QRDVERERVEDRRLAVGGILLAQRFHRFFVRERARLVIDLVGVLVVGLDRRDVVLLALRLGARRLGARDRCRAVLQATWRRRAAERVAQRRDGHAPVRDAARGIGLGDGVEALDGLGEPERVLQRDRALELRLNGGIARRRKVDLPEALGRLRT